MTPRRAAFVALFLLGAGLRAIDVWHPVDGSTRQPWRECDIAQIARNYYREDARILYPRIDWRGTGPGYVEMEFPATPWLMSMLYRVFGFHEVLGRLLVYAFSLATLAAFFRLAAYLLPGFGGLAASAFFALSPGVIRVSNTLQPEAFMLLWYVLAVYAFARWLDGGSWRHYALAIAATALAVLGKSSAAHIGLLFAALLLHRRGLASLRDVRVWAFAILSLAPPLLWYAHANALWTTYGNSLGLSNEAHWIGRDFFTTPDFADGLLTSEVFYVWTPAGLLVALVGIVSGGLKEPKRLALYWLAATLALYVLAARTMSAAWALYYHIVSVPPAALLFGIGVAQLQSIPWRLRGRTAALAVGGTAALVFAALLVTGRSLDLYDFYAGYRLKALVLAVVAGFLALLLAARRGGTWTASRRSALARYGGAVAVGLTLLLQAREVVADAHPRYFQPTYACAQRFARSVPEGAPIVASGGWCRTKYADPAQHNNSEMFYLLDRKGFSICVEEQSVPALRALARQGARFFAARKVQVQARAGLEADLRSAFKLVDECPDWFLFDLTAPPAADSAPSASRPSAGGTGT